MALSRTEILNRLHEQIERGQPILGAGAGTGLSAKCLEAGGVDLIVIYNSGRFRMAGRGSLAGMMPYGDANAIVVDMASEVLPVVKDVPVLAGVCGTDPFRLMPVFLRQIRDMGFSGIQNFPTVCLYDGLFRTNLEETGMGYALEVDLVREARALDLFTSPYAATVEEAEAMADAGADIVVAHMGLTSSGLIGASTTMSLDDAVTRVKAIHDAAKAARNDVIVLCHGGPIAQPEDAQYVLDRVPGVDGFYGASSIERLASEVALIEATKRFKNTHFSGA
ncbi:MAG: phosphoenolpyruvate hydrolase family protein [Thermomicrobiales bacterium]